MANKPSATSASCISYHCASPPETTEPPELDYRYFTPEFLDELEEHYQALAVGQLSAEETPDSTSVQYHHGPAGPLPARQNSEALMAFVHLHNHTEHSSLDGLTRIKSVAKRAAELGQTAMAITDHGSLAGAWRFTKACKAAGIKPIIGIEIYMSIGDRFERNSEIVDRNDDTTADADDGKGDTKEKRYEHLTLLARNEQGWKNLLALHNKAEESYWYKPRIDYKLLKEHGEGLIILSGCLAGPVAGPLSRAAATRTAGEAATAAALEAREADDEAAASKLDAEAQASQAKSAEFAAEARQNLDTLTDCVGKENVYLEIMYHSIEAEQSVLKPIGQLSREYEIPMVPTDPSRLFSAIQKNEGFSRSGGRCEMDGVFFMRGKAKAHHGDHHYPWSKGGSTSMANFVAACARHNTSKGAKVPTPWATMRMEARRRKYFPQGVNVKAGERFAQR